MPHASQKLALGRFSTQQALQYKGSGAAHSLQNFAPVRFSQPQRGQSIVVPSLCKRLEQSLGLAEVGGVKSLGEPAIHLGQHLTGRVALALLLPQPGQAHGGP